MFVDWVDLVKDENLILIFPVLLSLSLIFTKLSLFVLGGGLTLKQLVTLLSSLNREDEEVLLVGEDRRGGG